MAVWLLVSPALARPADPGVACRIPPNVAFGQEPVELPLLRGPNTAFLPAVEGALSTPGGDRPGLFVVDLGGGCSRVDPATARAIGLPEPVDGIVVTRIQLGALSLDGVRLRVDPDAPGLVVGLPSLGGVAGAVLPSQGLVTLAPRSGAAALLASVGGAVDVPGRRDDPLHVPGAMRWGPVVVDGTFALRTDRAESHLAPVPRLPAPVRHGGRDAYDVGIRLGADWLADTWILRDPSTAAGPPDPAYVGEMGYDVLFAVDLAVDPAGRQVAFRPASADRSRDATGPTVAAARARYAAEEAAAAGTDRATKEPTDPRATIGFDGPAPVATSAAGNPGNAVVRDRNRVLADALWRAGLLDEALPYWFAAARYAGDHCGAHLDLAQRRMAWAGSQRASQDLVRKLVDDPLERAVSLWTAWSALGAAERDAVRAGRAPAGGPQVEQPDACGLAPGLRHRVLATAGDPSAAAFAETWAVDPGVTWSRMLAELDAGRWSAAEDLLPRGRTAVEPLWGDLVAIRLAAVANAPARVEDRWANVPGAPTDAPLVSALLVLDAARRAGRPEEWTRKLLRQDPRWIPGQLVHALASRTPPPAFDPSALARSPGSPQIRCQLAVHRALAGDAAAAAKELEAVARPAEPDWWAAVAVVAHVRGDAALRDRAVAELKWRFPLLPVDRLGLVDP